MHKIIQIPEYMNDDDTMLKAEGRSFGMGICSTIVGDRLLGLGNKRGA